MKPTVVCIDCGNVGKARKYCRGSVFLELFLWLCFLLPGIVYSIWRYTGPRRVCSKCMSPNIIPPDSPRGRELITLYHQDKAALT